MSFFQISCLITFLVSFIFGLSALISNRKSKLNRIWFFTALSISAWSIGFFGVVSASNYDSALFYQYFLDGGGVFIAVTFFNFILELLGLKHKYKKTSYASWLVAFILFALSFTSLFKKGMVSYASFNYWISPGILYPFFPLTFIFFSLFATLLLIKKYKEDRDRVLKEQIKFVLLAQVFGVGGGITNFFPQLFKVYPFGNYLVSLYIIFISYAIFKHHLFNIRIVATELFTLAIAVVLLIRTLLFVNYTELVINGIIFFAVSAFGVLLVRSVTKEVKQREQIEAMAEQVGKAYEIEKNARKELERLDAAKSQFLMATQHHLRTPLTAMRGYMDLLFSGSYGKIPLPVKGALKKFESSTVRLLRVVNELLDISQFQLGKEVVSLQPNVDIEPIMKEIKEELSFEAQTKGIYLKIEKPPMRLPRITADLEKLKVALFNLVDNAIKYTNEGGVTIKFQITNSKLQIVIQDTGMGIVKEDMPTLFTRFFERTKEAEKAYTTGRGIGLYIASKIIQAHHGKLWAESEGKGKGATFFVELPVG